MTIGPSRVSAPVLAAMAVSPPPITDPGFLAAFARCLQGLRPVFGLEGGCCIVVPGTGTIGLEMVAANLVQRGASVLVLSTGFWGDRWTDICTRLGLVVDRLAAPVGEAPDAAAIAERLERTRYSALFVVHVDSSSAVRVDLERIAAIAGARGVPVLVDGISSAGIEAVRQSVWGLDAFVASTPKGLGVPAGLILLGLSDAAVARIEARTWACPSHALDLAPWLPVMRAAERGAYGYCQSPAGNLVLALDAGLQLVLGEGMEARARRHAELARTLHAGLESLGIRLMVSAPNARAHGLTVCFHPDHRTGREFLERVQRAGVLLPAGLYPDLAEHTFRIGHLGNVTRDDVTLTLEALATSTR